MNLQKVGFMGVVLGIPKGMALTTHIEVFKNLGFIPQDSKNSLALQSLGSSGLLINPCNGTYIALKTLRRSTTARLQEIHAYGLSKNLHYGDVKILRKSKLKKPELDSIKGSSNIDHIAVSGYLSKQKGSKKFQQAGLTEQKESIKTGKNGKVYFLQNRGSLTLNAVSNPGKTEFTHLGMLLPPESGFMETIEALQNLGCNGIMGDLRQNLHGITTSQHYEDLRQQLSNDQEKANIVIDKLNQILFTNSGSPSPLRDADSLISFLQKHDLSIRIGRNSKGNTNVLIHHYLKSPYGLIIELIKQRGQVNY